ncbi:MAG: PAS domain S-box protein [Campylobacterota bacterium]|nr:PAS domain S-box protein [Campylobacterota bacterium]
MNNIINILKKSKILMPVLIVSFCLGGFLFYYIPIVMEQSLIQTIIKNSQKDVEKLQILREYYTKNVVRDVQQYNSSLSFNYNHQGVNGKIPFPTTIIHDLSKIYSQRSDIKLKFYSNYPFLNRKNRKLTEFQKEAIQKVKKDNNGFYVKKDIINDKKVLRIIIADYMILPTCVDCHNSHKLKNWDFKWKVGDMRGVLEIITPINKELEDMNIARNKIVLASLSLMLVLFIYYLYISLKREKELVDENEELKDEFNDLFDDFDKYVIVSKTDLKGKITYASNSFCNISGYTKDELIGKNHNIIRDKSITKDIFKNMWKTIESNKVWQGEIKNRRKDGSYYWVYTIISPLYNNNSEKIGYSAITEDISNKKKVEELNKILETKIKDEVKKNRDKDKAMIEQSRLAQMGEMISMIAHQWRQPLAAINSTSITINLKSQLDTLDNQTAMELSNKITDYSEHLSSTIDDFRNFFKSNKERKYITYSKVIDSVLKIIEVSIINKNIIIEKNLNSDILFYTYQNELKQVLLNLMKNAEDVLLEKKIKNPKITIETNNNILLIKDNGGGIDDDICEKIFDPYFSTKIQKDGTGLGLYMSKTIIEEHCHGKLSVSNDNEGAVFKIELNR